MNSEVLRRPHTPTLPGLVVEAVAAVQEKAVDALFDLGLAWLIVSGAEWLCGGPYKAPAGTSRPAEWDLDLERAA